MKIVIVGAGKVGEVLCRDLSLEGYDIVLIEQNRKRLDDIINIADVTGVAGNGASYNIQVEAGVDSADIFIAVSEKDELNIIASIMAKKIGAKHTIARVRSPEYSQNVEFAQKELGITFMINPERESAKSIIDILKFPSAISVDTFMQNKVNIVEFLVTATSPIAGIALKDIKLTKENVLICAVERNGEVFIPDGNFIIREEDKIQVTGTVKALNEFTLKCAYSTKPIKSVLIVGGGEIGYYLASDLLNKKIRVKIIEIDEKRAEYLSEELPGAIVIHGDGTDHEILLEQRIEAYDAVVSCTPIDEENIMLSMFSSSIGISKNIVKISRNLLNPIAVKLGLDSIISPKKIIADTIIRYVRSILNTKGSRVENLHRLINNQIEAIQFSIKEDSEALGISLKNLKIKPDVLFACIRREDKIIYPNGDDFFLKGDNVLVITKLKFFNELEDVLVAGNE